MAEKVTRWDASDHLKTEEDIMAYFEACLAMIPETAATSVLS